MKCLVCHEFTRITRFQELFSLAEPLLCVRCQSQLKRKSSNILYERNMWLDSVIKRLDQGDICLNQIFFYSLKGVILNYLNGINEILVLESESKKPYPWLELLVTNIMETVPQRDLKGEQTLVITPYYTSDYELTVGIML